MVKVGPALTKPWWNENPGEGGVCRYCYTVEEITVGGKTFPPGSRVSLGGGGHRLHRVEGGWVSRPFEDPMPVRHRAGRIAVRVVLGNLMGT